MFDDSIGDNEPDVQPDFRAGTALLGRLMVSAKTLPILHNPDSDRVRYVLHFSDNVAIQQFRSSHVLAWADVVCASIAGIKEITNAPQPKLYRALYILRIGLAADEMSLEECGFFSDIKHNLRGGCHEYALGQEVGAGKFGKILISLNTVGTDFI